MIASLKINFVLKLASESDGVINRLQIKLKAKKKKKEYNKTVDQIELTNSLIVSVVLPIHFAVFFSFILLRNVGYTSTLEYPN